MMILLKPIAFLGHATLEWIRTLGQVAIFFGSAIAGIFQPRQFPRIVQQLFHIGARSSLIIILVGLFTGMVLGLQSYYALVKFGAGGAPGTLVGLSLVKELGPVLTAIMITARAGSAMTAEIGIQRISEQIDALKTMGINPLRYLISPRIAASIASFPILTALFDLIGILGGYIAVVFLVGVTSNPYFYRVQAGLGMGDIMEGFIKSLVFALIVSNATLRPVPGRHG